MIRALFELIITIILALAARAILSSIMKSVRTASSDAFGGRRESEPQGTQAGRNGPSANTRTGGDLHKDPVCGTYVAESTPFHRQISGRMFYYCSDSCREKHALVAR